MVDRVQKEQGNNKHDKSDEEMVDCIESLFNESCERPAHELKKDYLQRNELKFTDQEVVRRVYYLAGILSQTLNDVGLFYWSSGGTTLGMLRHNGLIPWDDDLDICVRNTDVDKLSDSLFSQRGLVVKENSFLGYRIFHQTDSIAMQEFREGSDAVPGLDYRYPFCDVFVMRRKRQKYEPAYPGVRITWPDEWYHVTDIEHSDWRKFGRYELRCPCNAEQYLVRMYGEDWNQVGRTHSYCHKTRSELIPVAFEMTLELSHPAGVT